MITMILLEAVVLSILGAVAGVMGALALTKLLTRLPAASGFVLVGCFRYQALASAGSKSL